MSGFRCQFYKGSLMKVHYPKLYNMAHLSLNLFTASKGSNNYILFYTDLDNIMSATPHTNKLILGDLKNARVSTDHLTWEGVLDPEVVQQWTRAL